MRLLLAEDDRVVRVTVGDALAAAGFEVDAFADGETARRALAEHTYGIVLADVRMPGLSGIELFRVARRSQPGVAVVLMTAWADTNDAVTVMREGARDYITKPFELSELVLRVSRVRDDLKKRRELERPGDAGRGHDVCHQLRGGAEATRRLIAEVDAAAASDVSVLITGETGTGKDLCARTIHARSQRSTGPFVAINCAAIPEGLVESELFGHERGAFTGADRRREGRFAAAHRGTLFLDEIGELPLIQQAKLLRAIDTRTIEPLGTTTSVEVDVRIIAATNADLEAAVAQGRFRRDLYYRLNVIAISTPPLRERRADIPGLAADFLAAIAVRQRRSAPTISPAAMALLTAHDYPGNVRELIHALERAVAVTRDDVILPAHLPLSFGGPAPPSPEAGASLASVVEQFERQYIAQVLKKVGGHRGQAAQLLGISRKSLWQKLRDEDAQSDGPAVTPASENS